MSSHPLGRTNMQYVRLGNSGLKISRIILGCMTYGDSQWRDWVLGEDEGLKHIKFAYESGIQTFDTANAYSNGLSETILGKAIKKYNLPRGEIVVMTKIYPVVLHDGAQKDIPGGPFPGRKAEEAGYVNQAGLSRKHVFDSVKKCLERLQLEYIDVLQCDRWDSETPIEETMQALHDVVKAGYVRYLGMSSCYAWQFQAIQNFAVNNKLTPFISMQNHYNLLYREEEREMMPLLKALGVGSIPWSPLARGVLVHASGERLKRESVDMMIPAYRKGTGSEEIINRVEQLAKERNLTMAQIALAWILHKNEVCAPILGVESVEQLEEALGALSINLTTDEIKFLEEPYQTRAILGHS